MVMDDPRRGRFRAMLEGRCPRCRAGRIFRSRWTMNEACPECGLAFTRGPGYFTGAMYFSYALGIPIIGLLTLAVFLLRPNWRFWQDVLVSWLVFLPLVPAVYRASRVLWIYFDRTFDPE